LDKLLVIYLIAAISNFYKKKVGLDELFSIINA